MISHFFFNALENLLIFIDQMQTGVEILGICPWAMASEILNQFFDLHFKKTHGSAL